MRSTRDKMIMSRVSGREDRLIKSQAKKAGMTLSAYVRSVLLHSANDGTIRAIDIAPLKEALYELKKQGVNLNQFMRFLNTYGVEEFNPEEAERVMEMERRVFWHVLEALSSLRDAAEKEGISIAYSNPDEEASAK